MTEERKVQLGLSVDATEAKKGFAEVKRGAQEMVQSVSASGKDASKAISSIGDGGEASAKKVDATTKSLIQSIQRTTAVMEAGSRTSAKYFEVLATQRGVDVNALKPYLDQLDAVAKKQQVAFNAINATNPALQNMGVSAAQTSAALRQLPAQFSDIVTSLQGGQKPLSVFLQQGSQIKDSFGGAGPAVRAMASYVTSLINPFTLAAGAVGLLTVAYFEGKKEVDAYAKALILTGNAAGLTAGQLAVSAQSVSKAVGTQGAAAAVLAQLAGNTKIASDGLEQFTRVALQMDKAGKSVGDTVKELEALGEAPVEASIKLNKQYNYLTAAVFQQINALQQQGRADEAAAVAQKAYADAFEQRSRLLVDRLGTAEKSWNSIKDAAKGAWDSMLDVGRGTTAAEDIADIDRKIAALEKRARNFRTLGNELGATDAEKRAAALRSQRAAPAAQSNSDALRAAERGIDVKVQQIQIDREKEMSQIIDRQVKLERELKAARLEDIAAGLSQQQIDERQLAIRKKYADVYNDSIDSQIEAIKRRGAIEEIQLKAAGEQLRANQQLGLSSEREYIEQVGKLELAAFDRRKANLEQELALAARKQNSLKEQASLRGEIAQVEAERERRVQQLGNDLGLQDYNAQKKATEFEAEELKKRGRLVEAYLLEFRLKYKEAWDGAIRDGQAGKPLADAIARVFDAGTLEAQFAEAKTAFDAAFSQMASGVERVNQAAEADGGIVARINAAGIAQSIRAQALPALTEMSNKLTEIADRSGNDALKKQATDIGRNLQKASFHTEQVWKDAFKSMDNTFQGGMEAAMDRTSGSWETYTKSLGRSFTKNVADVAYQAFLRPIAIQLVATGAGALGFTGLANAASAAGNASSLLGGVNAASSLSNIGSFLGIGGGAMGAIGASGVTATGLGTASGLSLAGTGSAAAGLGGSLGSGLVAATGTETATVGTAIAGAGGTTAAGGLSAAFAAIPGWGWAALGAGAAYAAFSGGGETRYGGGYDVINGKTVLGGGPSGGEIQGDQTRQMIQNAYDGLNGLLKAVGSTASVNRFTAGLESSENGKGATFAGGFINGQQFGSTYETTQYNQKLTQQQAFTQFTEKLQQSVLIALQKAGDIPKAIQDKLDSVDIGKLSTDASTALIKEISDVQTLQHALAGLPFANLKNLSFDAADGLLAAAGGLDALNANLTGYYQNFFTEEEKKAQLTKTLTDEFAKLGFALPTSREQFRQMVESVKDFSPEGAKAEAGLLKLQGALSDLLPPLKELSATADVATAHVTTVAELFSAQMGAVDSAFSALGRSVDAEKAKVDTLYQAQRDAIQQSAQQQKDLAQLQLDTATGSLQAIQSIYGTLTGALQTARGMSRDEAKGILDSALNTARAGRSIANVPGLEQALQVVTQTNEQAYATHADFVRDQALVASKIEDLRAYAGAQQSAGEMMVEAIRDSIKATDAATELQLKALEAAHQTELAHFDDLIARAQAQIDALKGVDNTVKSVEDAIRALNGSLSAAKVLQSAPQNGTSQDAIATLYESVLGRSPDAAGAAFWQKAMTDNPKPWQDFVADFVKGAVQTGGADAMSALAYQQKQLVSASVAQASGFATTDLDWSARVIASLPKFDVGTNYVPYDMPAIIHRGERIFTAADNAAIVDALRGPRGMSADVAAELQALRDETKQLKQALEPCLIAIAKNTLTSADVLEASSLGQRPLQTVSA